MKSPLPLIIPALATAFGLLAPNALAQGQAASPDAVNARVQTQSSSAQKPDELPPGEVIIPDALKQRIETEGWSAQWHDALYDHEDPRLGLTLRRLLRAKRDASALQSRLVAHEWGSLKHHMGSKTSEFDLLGEDQSDLPGFVKVWSDQPAEMPMIMEKPILYFYTKDKMRVNVTARFPEGLLTQWYPDATSFFPKRDDRRQAQGQLANGTLSWQQLVLDPTIDPTTFAKVNDNHPWWHITRDTDATPIRALDRRRRPTTERFLFYRGAGSYIPMVEPSPDTDDFSVTVPFSQIDLRGVFLVRVNDSGATITHAPLLRAQATLTIAGPEAVRPVERAALIAKAQLTDSLEAAGLFPKEAAGLVEIWGDDMFTTPGQRLLYLMPNNEVERVLPLDIQPKPDQTVRTLIAWVERSTPQAEKRITDLVNQLSSDNAKERSEANKALRKLDRFAEAILRRTLETTDNPRVRAQVQQILQSLDQKRQQGHGLDR